ncbi:MAG: Hsp20/alpha crystallin family protein [Myxococcaceae bacterium]|jgi:HSP20 family protein|nr:Hsp20/alpha crystallin family protein [Myxococcaceae bacterium]MCA3013425.1 Hsp20/alpha crystallin family protein [Myxococcaceae bacterium]
MNLTQWDPFRELEEMSNRLNRAFTRPAPSATAKSDSLAMVDWSPSVDIVETAEDFQVKAELPEVKREDVKVNVSDGLLRIEGERRFDKEDKSKKYHRVERFYGSFMRSFALPDGVEAEKARAEFKDGLLTVRLPKSAKAQPRSVDVKIG